MKIAGHEEQYSGELGMVRISSNKRPRKKPYSNLGSHSAPMAIVDYYTHPCNVEKCSLLDALMELRDVWKGIKVSFFSPIKSLSISQKTCLNADIVNVCSRKMFQLPSNNLRAFS